MKFNPDAVAHDYFGYPIKVGDRVIFPAGAKQMEGVVTKLGNNARSSGEIRNISVKNDSGYTKVKTAKACVNVTLIRSSLPEYEL